MVRGSRFERRRTGVRGDLAFGAEASARSELAGEDTGGEQADAVDMRERSELHPGDGFDLPGVSLDIGEGEEAAFSEALNDKQPLLVERRECCGETLEYPPKLCCRVESASLNGELKEVGVELIAQPH